MAEKALTLIEIANRIRAHLRRFEDDPVINVPVNEYRPFYNTSAHSTGKNVAVSYVSYQGVSRLPRAKALAYLAWLDAGNVGKHYKVPKEKSRG